MPNRFKLHSLFPEIPGKLPRCFRRAPVLLAVVCSVLGTLPASAYELDRGGKWSVPINWSGNLVPQGGPETDVYIGGIFSISDQDISSFVLNDLEIRSPWLERLTGKTLYFDGSEPSLGRCCSYDNFDLIIENNLVLRNNLTVYSNWYAEEIIKLSGQISGAGGLTIAANVSLHTANTYDGGTRIRNGAELFLAGSGTLGATGYQLSLEGGTLNLGAATRTVGQVNASGPGNGARGTITNGTLSLSNSDLFFQSGTIDANLRGNGNSRLWLGGNSLATIDLGGINTIDFNDHNSTIIGHPTTGAAGTVRLTSPTGLGPAAVGGNTITAQLFAGTIDANGQAGVTVGILRLAGGAGSRVVNTDTRTTASFKGKIQVDLADTEFGGDGNMTFSNVISGAGGIHKTGAGEIAFNMANTYALITTISAGTLQIGGSGTVGAPGSRLRLAGGTLNLGGTTQTVGRVNSSGAGNGAVGTIINGSLILNENLFFQSGTLAPALRGSGNSRLWLGGDSNATIILGGTNTIDFIDHSSTIIGHPTTGAAGTVRLTSPAALGPAAVGANTITAQLFAGTIDANGQAGITVGNLLLVNGAGSKLVNGNTGASASLSGKVSIAAAGTEIGGAGDMTFSNVISGAGGFKKTGNGTITLNAANTYTGATEVADGALVLTSTAKLSTAANVTVNAGAILQLNPGFNSEAAGVNLLGRLHGSGQLIAPVTIQSGGQLAPGLSAAVGTLNLASLQLNAGSVLDFEGDGSGFDRINIIRDNGLVLAGLAEIKLTDLGSLAAGDYVLIDYSGSALESLNNLQLSSASFGAFDVSLINNKASTSIDLHVTAAVPEPSAYALMGLGLLAMGLVVRRRADEG